MIRSEAVIFLWLAWLLLLFPLNWLLSALFAACFHELCHMSMLLLLGGKIREIHISPHGCEIESTAAGDWQALWSILAGPVGSLFLCLFSGIVPQIAVCGFVHGVYNLLPILPLDGGRILQLLLYRFCPDKAEKRLYWTGMTVCAMILICGICICVTQKLGIFPVIMTLFWFLRMFPRKIPCKPSEIGVQ